MWRIENPQFDNAHGIATDSAGNVYVADTNNNRIQKFTPGGTLLASLGVGRLINPYGVAVDMANNVYVADTGGHRIQKFRSDGTFVATWGTHGSGDGEFAYPSDLAVDSAGNVYVTDTDNNRVQKFAPDGTLIAQWGTVGSEDSQLSFPRGIAVDTTGNVYVADTGHGWLKKFTSNGTFLLKWETVNTGDKPNGVSVDTAGRVYVTTDRDLCRFTSNGDHDTTFGYIGVLWDRGPDFVYDVAPDNAGNLYLLHNSPAGDVSWVGQCSSTGALITEWGRTQPYDIAADGAGNVYVMDSVHTEIVKFSSTGTRLVSWGGEGSGVGQFKDPKGIAVDRAGNVYVADAGNHRVQKFTANGNFTLQWPGQHRDQNQNIIPVTSSPQGITVDSAGFVYIANLDQFVQKYTPNGVLVTEFLARGVGEAPGIAVDRAGNVYVADTYYGNFKRFTSAGEPLYGSGWTGFSDNVRGIWPYGIVIDNAGNFYFDSMYYGWGLYRTSSDLNVTAEERWNGGDRDWNVGVYPFGEPRGIAADDAGNVYVANTFFDSIVKFSPTHPTLTVESITPDSAGQTEADVGVTVRGTGFPAGTTFSLINSRNLMYVGCLPNTLTRVSDSELRGNVSFAKVPAGLYNVEVKTPGSWTDKGDIATLEKGFSVSSVYFQPKPDGYQFDNPRVPETSWSLFKNTFEASGNLEFPDRSRTIRAQWFYEKYVQTSGKDGVCFGMAASSLHIWKGEWPGERAWDLGNNDAFLPDPPWKAFATSPYVRTISEWIQSYHIRQNTATVLKDGLFFSDSPESIRNFYSQLKAKMADPISYRQDPYVLGFHYRWLDGNGKLQISSHAVAPIRIEEIPGTAIARIYMYEVKDHGEADRYFEYDSATGRITSPQYPFIDDLYLFSLSTIEEPAKMPDLICDDIGATHLLFADALGRHLGYLQGKFVSEIPGASRVGQYAGDGDSPETYYLGGRSVRTEVIGTGTGFGNISIMRPSGVAIINASVNPNSTDEVRVPPSGSSVEYISGSGTDSLQLTLAMDGESDGRKAVVDGFAVDPSKAVDLSFGENRDDVSVVNTGKKATVNFSLERVGPGSGTFVPGRSLMVEDASSVRIVPSDWTNLDHTSVTVEHDLHNDGVVDYSETFNSAGVPGTPTQGTPTPTQIVTSTPTQDPRAPVANFTWSPVNVTAGVPVTFWDTSTGNPTAWRWMQDGYELSTGQNLSVTFTIPCTSSISLVAMNSYGWSAPKAVEIYVVNQTVTPTPTVKPITGGAGSPSDTNGDGTCDDVNGNGRKDFADVVLYFNQMTWIGGNEPVGLFDFNGNGRIDFADVVWLFNHL